MKRAFDNIKILGYQTTLVLYIITIFSIFRYVRVKQSYLYLSRSYVQKRFLRMDDESHRLGVKQEITTKEFRTDAKILLSRSGHDLTPLIFSCLKERNDNKILLKNFVRSLNKDKYATELHSIGLGQKGLYVSSVGINY